LKGIEKEKRGKNRKGGGETYVREIWALVGARDGKMYKTRRTMPARGRLYTHGLEEIKAKKGPKRRSEEAKKLAARKGEGEEKTLSPKRGRRKTKIEK